MEHVTEGIDGHIGGILEPGLVQQRPPARCERATPMGLKNIPEVLSRGAEPTNLKGCMNLDLRGMSTQS